MFETFFDTLPALFLVGDFRWAFVAHAALFGAAAFAAGYWYGCRRERRKRAK
ncbi:MAG: hypothetical protein J6I31_06430 [Prevotella sp.]|nr:hypothetical protein [Prevotella sp.]